MKDINIIDMASGMLEINTKEMELAAIWLTEPVPTIDGKKHCRFATGDRITINDSKQVADGASNATVMGCYGTLTSSVLNMMVLMDNGNGEIIKIA